MLSISTKSDCARGADRVKIDLAGYDYNIENSIWDECFISSLKIESYLV